MDVTKCRSASLTPEDQAGSLPGEGLLGVYWGGITHNGHDAGFVVTPARMVISDKTLFSFGFGLGAYQPCNDYLGPYSKASDTRRAIAQRCAAKLLASKTVALAKESIVRIGAKSPTLYHTGYLLFLTAQGNEILKIGGRWGNPLVNMLPALIEFAPERVYDDKTGRRYYDSRLGQTG